MKSCILENILVNQTYLSLRFLVIIVYLLVDFVNLENQWVKLHGAGKTPMSKIRCLWTAVCRGQNSNFWLETAQIKQMITELLLWWLTFGSMIVAFLDHNWFEKFYLILKKMLIHFAEQNKNKGKFVKGRNVKICIPNHKRPVRHWNLKH